MGPIPDSLMVEPPNSVILIVGRDEFTPPLNIGPDGSAATEDCVAVATVSVQDAQTRIGLGTNPQTDEYAILCEYLLRTDGVVSIRNVLNEVYLSHKTPGPRARVRVWVDTLDGEPLEISVQILDPSAQEAILSKDS